MGLLASHGMAVGLLAMDNLFFKKKKKNLLQGYYCHFGLPSDLTKKPYGGGLSEKS
jgi:hypothetical protein